MMTLSSRRRGSVANVYVIDGMDTLAGVAMDSGVSGDGPFGSGADIGVGFSDTAILVVSLLGFVFLATTVYSLILLRVQSKEEFEKAEGERMDYDEQLERADVATLTRAQRRQRAQLIMKRQRRIAPIGGNNLEEEEEQHVDDENAHLSRKERQKAAKAAERKERKLFEEQRREQQKRAQELAKKEKKERERLEEERSEEEKQLRLKAKEEQERAAYGEWNTFLKSRSGDDVMTVREFNDLVEAEKVVSIDELSDRFKRPSAQVRARIQDLVRSCRLTGVVDSDHFIYITHDEMAAVAKSITEQKQVSLQDLAKTAHSLINL